MALLMILLAGSGCATRAETGLKRFEYQDANMGTLFRIVLYATNSEQAMDAADKGFARVARLNTILTDYDPRSELMRLCRSEPGKPVRISPELFEVLDKSLELARQSHGAFDITASPVIRLWREARKSRRLPDPAAMAEALTHVGYTNLVLDRDGRTATLKKSGILLDVGGIAKGYAAEEALKAIQRMGIRRALVAASGDIALGDPPPGKQGWAIDIAPSGDRPVAQLLLRNCCISSSGDAEQYLELDGRRYSHVIDPRTGEALTNRIAVTVIARHGLDSDGLDTTISVLGVTEGMKLIRRYLGAKAVAVEQTPEGRRVTASPGFGKIN